MEKKSTHHGPKRWLLNAFILFHLMMLALWGLPGSNFRYHTVRWFERYVVYFGLWHGWDMFSPDPLSINFNIEAEILRADGTKEYWEFPRMERIPLMRRYQMERWRKWRERVRQDSYSVAWDDTCKWIARSKWNPANPPRRITLTRQWSTVLPPDPNIDYHPIPKEYGFDNNFTFKVYDVPEGGGKP